MGEYARQYTLDRFGVDIGDDSGQSKSSQSKDTAVLVDVCLSHSKPKSSTRKTQGT